MDVPSLNNEQFAVGGSIKRLSALSENPKIRHILDAVELTGLEYLEICELASLLNIKALQAIKNNDGRNSDSGVISSSILELSTASIESNSNSAIDCTKIRQNDQTQKESEITANPQRELIRSEILSEPEVIGPRNSKTIEATNALDIATIKKCISISQINDIELLLGLLAQNKPIRRIAVDVPQKIKGVRLEFGQTSKTLVIKGKSKAIAYRCVLDKWTIDEVVSVETVAKLLNQYIDVGIKLKRKPTTKEFKLHTQKLETIGDAIRAYIEFNINNTKGEGSNEWKRLEALMRNHMSKPKTVTLPNKQKRSIILADECLYQMTKSDFECYLKVYEEANGTHDTIVSLTFPLN